MRLGASIESRPAEVETRKTFGHWEIDTVIGKKKGKNAVVLTLVERNTDLYITRKIPAKAASAVNSEIKQLFSRLWKKAGENFQDADSRPRT